MDSFEQAAYAVVALVLVVPVLVRVPAVRAWVVRLVSSAAARLTPEPEVDQDVLDLYEALRREQLLRDVARLHRVIATDEHMSAVRQIGNRMAYHRLLLDVGELRDVAPPTLVPAWAATWTRHEPAPSLAAPRTAPDLQYRPKVETLELGWRR